MKEQYPENDLSRASKSYHELYAEQEPLRVCDYASEILCLAMRNPPSLGSITMSPGSALELRTKYFDKIYSATLQRAGPNDSGPESLGILQTRSLLLGASGAKLSESVRLGSVDWNFLQATRSNSAEMKDALQYVRYFEIHIDTGINQAEQENGLEIPECCEYLRT